jgi:hypothetical protein
VRYPGVKREPPGIESTAFARREARPDPQLDLRYDALALHEDGAALKRPAEMKFYEVWS